MPKKTITYLEMTSPRWLRPARVSPAVALEPVSGEAPLVRTLHDRVAGPHDWASMYWSDTLWRKWATRARHWIITVDAEPAGLTSVIADASGSVELTAFGLAREFIGYGHGGHALTLSIRSAWSLAVEPEVRRVWLHTSSTDHSHALPNYLARGFTVFRTESVPVLSDADVFRVRDDALS